MEDTLIKELSRLIKNEKILIMHMIGTKAKIRDWGKSLLVV